MALVISTPHDNNVRLFHNFTNILYIYKSNRRNLRQKRPSAISRESPSTLCANKNSIVKANILTSSPKVLSTKKSLKSIAKMMTDSGISLGRTESSIFRNSHPHTLSNMLPYGADQELDRMVTQHYILRTAFGSDFAAPVNNLTKRPFKPGKNVVVLDVGCGSGIWTMEMATQFPHAHFIGIDRQATYPKNIKPKNCHFKQFNIDQSHIQLPFEDASVDYIFQRDINWDLLESSWLPLVQEFFRVLKPGGWIELVEPEIETYSSNPIYHDYIADKLVDSFYERDQDPFVSKRLSSFMAEAGFRRIQSEFQSLPLGWGYQKLSAAKKQITLHNIRENCQAYLRCSEFARAAANHHLDLLKSLQRWFTQEQQMSIAKYDSYVQHLPDVWFTSKAYVNWHRSFAQKPYI